MEQIFNMEGVRIKELGIQRPSWQCQTLDDDDSRFSTSSSDVIITHLQQSILKLCNAKVQYNDKLQILGVICLTIDNMQQEVVIKLNNTLKKVDSDTSSNTIITSLATTPPNPIPSLVTPPLSFSSRRKRTIPIKHAPVDKMSMCGAGPGDDDEYLSSTDDDDDVRRELNIPVDNLFNSSFQASSSATANNLANSPSEPGEVKRLKCDDDVLDLCRKPIQPLQDSIPPYQPYDFSRYSIPSNSLPSLSSNTQFNNSIYPQESDTRTSLTIEEDVKQVDIPEKTGYLNQDRHENEFMVDKLGMEGKKRRRRAPDESLTNEEILEYLGGVPACEVVKKEEEKFTCHRCYEQLPDLSKYLRHTLVVHSAYICHECGRNFTTKSSLLRHRPIHTGMRRFACSICKKAFYRKDKCKAHIKRHLLAIKPELGTGRINKNVSSPTILSTPNLCISPGIVNSHLNLPSTMSTNLLSTNIHHNICMPRSNISMHALPTLHPTSSGISNQIKTEANNLAFSMDEMGKSHDNIGLVKPFIALPEAMNILERDSTPFLNNRISSPAQYNLIAPHSNGSQFDSSSIPSSLELTTLVKNITKPIDITTPINSVKKTQPSHPVPTTLSLEANTISSSAFKNVESLLPV